MIRKSSLLSLLLLLCLSAVEPLRAQEDVPVFRVEQIRAELLDGVYHIDATIRLRFSQEMIDALRNGVPLVFAIELVVEQPKRFWPDTNIVQLEQRYSLRFHALTQQYVVSDLNTEIQHAFHSLSAAIDFLNNRTTVPTLDADLLGKGKGYLGKLRMHLVPEALPLALKVRAYTKDAWRASSQWAVWHIE